jgi:hypothetical protein
VFFLELDFYFLLAFPEQSPLYSQYERFETEEESGDEDNSEEENGEDEDVVDLHKGNAEKTGEPSGSVANYASMLPLDRQEEVVGASNERLVIVRQRSGSRSSQGSSYSVTHRIIDHRDHLQVTPQKPTLQFAQWPSSTPPAPAPNSVHIPTKPQPVPTPEGRSPVIFLRVAANRVSEKLNKIESFYIFSF